MQKNKIKTSLNAFVYSTNPDFKLEDNEVESVETLPNEKQKLHIKLDTKQRAGKAVTLITGFVGLEKDLEDLEKKLKNFCGTGGSVKDHEIIVQGDNREKILQWLQKNNYKLAKRV